jgi:NADH-quinone oxidoreductase subunit E/NADP-reducing hydrogenase subunit HndA
MCHKSQHTFGYLPAEVQEAIAETVLNEFKKQLKIEVGETSEDGIFSIRCLRCVGACGLAPVVLVGDKTYGRVAPDDVKAIIEEYTS